MRRWKKKAKQASTDRIQMLAVAMWPEARIQVIILHKEALG